MFFSPINKSANGVDYETSHPLEVNYLRVLRGVLEKLRSLVCLRIDVDRTEKGILEVVANLI